MKRSLRIVAAAGALALAPAMLHAQTYPISNYTPLAVPVVGPQFVMALTGSTLPSPSTTQACFYVHDEVSTTSTPLSIQTGTGVYAGSVTFTVPASYLATIAPTDISASGFLEAPVYFVPTGSTCTGTANPAYSGTANVLIEVPSYNTSSTNNLPQTNTALTSSTPVLFTVTGQYFAPSTIVQFLISSSTVNATTKYLSPYALQVTSPTIPSGASSAELQVVTVGSQGSYPALSQGDLGFYAVRQSTLGTPAVTPNPAAAGATLTFSAVSQDAGQDSMQLGGVPTGAITMTETNSSNATVGSTLTGALTTNPISTSFTAISGFTDNNTSDTLYSTIADFNGDGVPDVLVVESADTTYYLTVYPGAYPLGDFGSSATTSMPASCGGVYDVTPGDINGDGITDVALICADTVTGNEDYVIMLGNGDGTFTYSNTADSGMANGLALGDFFHHGKLDLAAIGTDPSETYTQINLYPGNGDGSFGATTITTINNPNLGFPSSPILSTDIDGDGYPDMVLNASSDLIVLVSNGDGTVGNASAGTPNFAYGAGAGATIYYAATGDVNNDGKTDILLTGNLSGEAVPVRHPLSIREKMRAASARRGIALPPTGEKSPATNQPLAVPPQHSPRYAAGSSAAVKPNAAKPKLIGPNVVALLNTSTAGSVSFATPVTSTVPAVANAPIAVANFDGDCCNDVLISDGSNLIVYSGNNTGAFTASDTNLTTPLPGGSEGLFALAGVDLNGDGAADLIYSAELTGSMSPQYSVAEALTTGTASASTVGNPGLPPGTYTVNYTYNGNSLAYTGSTTTLNPLTITTEATATTVMASQASVVFGQSETLTATIAQGATTSDPPTGSVTFVQGTTNVLGTVTLSGGQAVLSGVDLGVGSYTVKATYSGDTYNAASSGTVSFTVTQATPTLTWATPSPITSGAALTSTQLDATASVSGTYAYTPPAGTVLAVGSHTLSVTFTPADTTDYTTASGTATIFVNAQGNTIYSFCTQPSCADGTDPEDSLIQAADGNYYGTVDTGGALGTGAFFRVSSTGQEATLYSFGAQSGDGTMVAAALVQGTDGNFYGATQRGGANGAGTVFQVTPAGTQTTLYSFTADAAGSVSGLVEDSAGNFYGTKAFGGANSGGTIFKLTPSGSAFTFSTLYPFCSQSSCADGNAPFSGLVQGTDGNFYGTTEAGGANNAGTVYKITPGGAFTLVHSFSGSDGQAPYGGLVQGADGNFYGTTRTGGGSGDGTVYRMTPGGALTTLYSFSGTDGANPYFAVLALGSDGNFYGTASHGGGANDGTVFQITSGGALTTLHSFCSQASCTDGNSPIGGVVQGSDGNFYGATADGGTASDGSVFEVSPGTLAAPVQLSLSSPSIILGTPVTLSWNSLNAFSGTMQQCAAIILNGATPAAAGNWTGLQSGTLTAGVYSGSASISPTVVGTYTYGLTCGGVESAAPVSLTVNQATPTLTWAAPSAITFGTALSATQLDATASVPGTFVYSPPAGTVLTAGTQTLSVTFTPTDTTDYTTANKTVSLTVNQATPTITWAAPSAISYGTALSATQLDATASTAGTFVYTPASGTILTAGTQTLSVTFTPTDTTDYTTATKMVSLTVNKATPTITWAAPSAISYGTALSATQLDATASTAGTFVYTPASGTVLTAGTQTLSVTFTPTDTTDYTTATKTVSLTVNQATPTLTWTAPAAIAYGTALSATQLDATATGISGTLAGSFVYTPASGTVLTAGTQTLSVTFTPTDTTDYTTATKTVSITVNQATPTITWAAPAAINYGTALSATQLDATAAGTSGTLAGTFVYTPASGTVLAAGTQTLSVTFTPTDTTDYTTATKTVSITVNQATPTITWAAPAAINYGTALSATQLDATASTAGTFAYTPVAGTVLAAGTQTLSVTFTPTNTTDYTTATKTVSITVNQATPTLTWAAPSAINYGTALSATQLDATATGVSGTLAGTFVYTPASGTVLAAGSHTLSVTFTPTDTTDYTTATKTVSLTVNQATPTLTWAAPASIAYGTALSATQLNATASTAGTFAYTPASGAVLTAGTQTLSVTFTPTDTTDYTTATKTVSIAVTQATPTLTWPPPAPIAYGTALSATQLDATATGVSGALAGTFVYTPAAGTVLTAGTQTLSVAFTPTDTTDYTTATKTVSIAVGLTTPTLTWAAPASIVYGTALSATQLDATATGASGPLAGTFAYTPSAGTVLTAGTQTLSVTFTPTDTTDYSTATKTVSITVTQATPTLAWTAPASIAYGTALSATQLDATATGISGALAGTFVYTPASGTVLTAGSHTLSVTFTPTDTTDYTTATKTVSITVTQATPTLTWAAPSAIAYGTALSATQLDATATGVSGTLAGTFAYTPTTGTVLTAGSHTLSVTFTPTDTTDYTTATKTVSITVNQATPTLSWTAPSAIAYGTALSATQLDATAVGVSGTLAGTFVYTPASGTLLTAGTQTLSVTFTPTDTTDYSTATKTVSLTITQATPTVNWNPPPAIPYGTPLSATQLDANATGVSGTLAGTFAYNPPAGTVLTAGTHTLNVTFTPTDSTDYTVATGSITLGVSKVTPTVTWTAPAAIPYGTLLSATQLNATATGINGTLAGTFAYNPPSGTLLTAGTHALQVIFTPTDTTDYTNSNGGVSITVGQSTPTLSWTAPSAITYGTPLSATQLNATAAGVSGTLAGTFAYTPAAGTVLAVGTQTLSVTFTPTDLTDYVTATKTASITVNQYTLTVTANNLSIEQGQAIPALTYAITGFQNGDTQASSTSGAPSLSTTATQSSPAGTYPITPVINTLAATNYKFTFVNGTLTLTAFSIGSLSSDSIAAGSSAATITLTGSGFSANDVVTVNGTAISTTYNGPTSLTATIPSSYLTTSNTTLQIAVKDNSTGVTTAPTPFVVGPSVLAVTTPILPNITVNSAYTATLMATGGVTPYTWSIITGSLPTGLTLNSNTGTISGTPTAIGTPSFTVQAQDSESTPMTATATRAIGVNATQSLVYDFCLANTACPDGNGPTELIQADDGNFYGVTEAGGVNTLGTMFQLTPAGTETVLYNFCSQGADACTDGSTPVSLVLGGDGNFYGVTNDGGANEEGTVFQITPAGALTTLYSFCVGSSTCPDGMNPEIQLTPGGNGIFFGTTPAGGANGYGTVFEINTTGTFKTLYSFTGGTDGGTPNGLTQASDGNFYGMAQTGGYTNSACTFATCGTIFRIDTKGNLTTIYSFCSPAAGSCPDGYFPVGVLNEGPDGNLYGATQFGGSNGAGTVFNVTTAGTLTTLYNFCTGGGTTLCNTESGNPQNGISLGSDGNFYGASGLGGNSTNSDGAAFQMTTAGALTTIYNFCTLTNCDDGSYPSTPPVQGDDGNFYGTSSQGGSTNGPDNVGGGVIYKLTGGGLQAPVQLTASSGGTAYLSPFTLSWQVLNAFSATAQQCNAYVVSGGAAAGNWTGPQAGTLTAGVYSGSATLTPTTVGTYVFGLTCGGVESALPVSFTVNPDTTTTALTASTTTPAYGTPISLTATITPQNTGGAASTATVTFYDGEDALATVASSGFSATLTNVQLASGSHSLAAVFNGDTLYATSQGNLSLAITPATLAVTANNLSMQQGASVPTLTYGITGFQYSDTQATATTGAPTLSTTATSSSPVGTYPITVAQGTLAATNYIFSLVNGTLTVNANALGITTSTLPVGKTGTAYSTTLAASGGVAPYSWAVTTGALPAGLHLNATTGVISGTPTAAGATTFTITVTDSETTPMTAFLQFSISINSSENILDAFCQTTGCPDGENPRDGVIQASDGNFYGTTTSDGANNGGTVFKITPSGTLTTLYNFCSQANCADGSQPKGLRQAADGNFYSVALSGGITNGGTVFKITPAGVFTLLYQFCALSGCTDGETPTDVLLPGSDGNFYGTTEYGGENENGTVFKITPTGTLTTLYSFCAQSGCNDGGLPLTGLVQGADGNFYGVTSTDGVNENGTAFKITPTGTLTTLYSFCAQTNCSDGSSPNSNLVQGSDGNFYGVTQGGGNETNNGTIFNLTPAGALTTLYQFCTLANCADGAQPSVGMVLGSDGNFYGTTQAAGAGNKGTLFQLAPVTGPSGPAFNLNTMYSFCSLTNCADGSTPEGFVQGNDGNFYGTAEFGGNANNAGLIYELPNTPALPSPVQLSLSASTSTYGSPVTLSWQVLNAFSTTAQQCYAYVLSGGPTAGMWTGLQTGTLTAGAYSGSASITPTATGTYQYALTCGGVESAAPVNLTVTAETTTTTLASSATSSVYGVPISLTATITPTTPGAAASTATVTFYDAETPLGTVASSGFSATLTGVELAQGAHTLYAVYAGDANYQTSDGQQNVTVTPGLLTVTANNLSKAQGAANPPLTYAITGFQYSDTQANATTGAPTLSTTATQTSPTGTYPITITQGTLAAANYTFSLVNGTLNVTSNVTPPSITTTSLPYVTINSAYSTTLAATGGTAPYTWSVTQGTLPAGLSLAPTTGVISGTPTAAGLVVFSVTATDSEATPMTATASLFIAVNAAESVLYNFCSVASCADGDQPTSGVVQANDGNFYGTADFGGANNDGTLFRVTPSGAYTTLYSFCSQPNCTDGTTPVAGLVQGGNGNFYGMTEMGGANGDGVFFNITSSGAFNALYYFCSLSSCADGELPEYNLVQGSDGNFYGVTTQGGSKNDGTVFKVTSAGALTTLYSFCTLASCADGSAPEAALVQGSDGNFYGTTSAGGANNRGTVFQITPAGTLTTVYSFCTLANCADGNTPRAGLVEGADGNFYGTTYQGGNSSNPNGTVYKVTPAGTLTTLYSFGNLANSADGINPLAGLVLGSDGNFYGTTPNGGNSSNYGTVFQITPSGNFTTIYSFCSVPNCTDADFPQASLVQGSDGNFYSTAETGGSGVVSGAGAVYKVSPSPTLAAPVQLTLSSPSASLGTPVTLSWQVLNAFSTTLQQCYAFVLNGATTAGTWTGLQTGTLAAGVYSGSTSISPTATGTYTYGFTCGGVESAAPVSLTVTSNTGIATTTALTSSITSPVYGTPISLTATITPSNPSGPASSANVSFYDGATLLGTVASSGFTATLTGVQLAAGTQSLSAVYDGDSNYQTSTGTLSLIVTPAVLTVTANNLSKQEGAANPALTYTITGFQYADTQASATTGAPALSTTATTTSPTGAYPITLTQGTLAAANYTFNLVNGTLTVTGNALTLDTTSLPIGKVGVAYSTTLTASGGITPYSWSLTFGALPTGLSLNSSTGTISGTPTAPGVQTFTVQVTDSESPPAVQTVPISLAVDSNESIIAPLCPQTGCVNGSDPRNAVIEVSDGNLYGAAYQGGSATDGTIFKISPKGALSLLYTFCTQTGCPDGEFPQGLVEGPDGALYGTTFGTGSGVGASNFGTVFRITTAGSLTTLYSFCAQTGCTDGQGPGNLTFGSDGNLYGATGSGGANGSGSLFKITPAGVFTQLYSFCATTGCPDGSQPSAGLMQASDGNFYGVTNFGGTQNSGLLYKLTPAGAVTPLYSFCQLNDCADGSAPDSVLVQGANGDLYGATSTGGAVDDGALFDIALSGTFTLLDSFTGANGNSPNELVLGSDGNFYGTTQSLGEGNGGTFFELTPAGAQTTLYTFCSQPNCADGGTPEGQLQASDGEFYATASTGGPNGGGAIVQLPITPALPAPVQLALSSSTTVTGTPVRLTFNVLNAFSTTLQQCYAFVQNGATGAGNWTGVQTGALTSGVYTGTVSITPTAPGTYTYALTCGGVESGISGTLTVTPAKGPLALTSITPNAGNIGAADTTITLIGTGFSPGDQAQVNGTSITTTFVSTTTLTAVIPAADFAVPAVLEISVFDPTAVASTQSLPFTVSAPPVNLTFSGPSSSTSDSQPDLTFNLTNPYPVELTATLTLTFTGAEGVDDPNIEFANGSRTFSFNIAANSTTTPTIQLQTGTDAGNISIALGITLTSNGQDVTPNVNPVVINIPTEAPAITSMTLTRSGDTITANIMGYSNTRDMTQAVFTFTGALASTLSDPSITVPETTLFGGWYSSAPSDAFGSEFLYTQAFTLNDNNSNIEQITVTLTNSAGISGSATAQ